MENTNAPPDPSEPGPRLLSLTSPRQVIDVQLGGLALGTGHVALHGVVQRDPVNRERRLGLWSAVRGDGRAKVGWFTAPRMSWTNVYAAGLQGALQLMEGPERTVLADHERFSEAMARVRSSVSDAPSEECGYYYLLPEVLNSAQAALRSAPPFTVEVETYRNPMDFPPHLAAFYASLHLGSTVFRLLREHIPMDERTIAYLSGLPLWWPVSKDSMRHQAREYVCERRGIPFNEERFRKRPKPKPLQAPGGEWDCLPVGAAVQPAVEGVWRWASMDATGELRRGSVYAADRARAAETIAGECAVGSSCVSVLAPRAKGKGKGRYTLYPHHGDDCADAERAKDTAVYLSAQVHTKILAFSGPFMSSDVQGWVEPPPAVEADPYLLAVDAAWDPRHGIGTWACVTGGGWYASEQEQVANVQEAEFLAIARGMDLFPPGSELTVLTDNTQAEWAAKALQGGESPKQIAVYRPWLNTPRGLLMLMRLSLLFEEMGSVNIERIPRNSHPLHDRADQQAKRQLQISRHQAFRRHQAP